MSKSNVVEDKDLIKSISYMKSSGLLKESKSVINFESVKEAEDNSKEDIVSAINDKLSLLKSDISEVRKGGYDLDLEGIKLLGIPLKIIVWKATRSEEDLKKIIKIFDSVEVVLNKTKKDYEEKLKEKELREIEKERVEKEKADEKEMVEKEKADEKERVLKEKERTEKTKSGKMVKTEKIKMGEKVKTEKVGEKKFGEKVLKFGEKMKAGKNDKD